MADQEQDNAVEESQDLFGFDELYKAPDPAAKQSSEGGEANPVFDETDCLFNFDEIHVEGQVEEEVSAEEVMAGVPELPQDEQPEESDDSETSTEPDAAIPAEAAAKEHSEQTPELATSSKGSLSTPLLWILLISITLNLGVVGFTWRVSGKMSDEFSEATLTMIQATQDLQTSTPSTTTEPLTSETIELPVISSDPEHEYTFDRAREEIAEGDYATARKRLYALLSVADRFKPDVRERIESTAQFILADISMAIAMEQPGDQQ